MRRFVRRCIVSEWKRILIILAFVAVIFIMVALVFSLAAHGYF